MKYVKKMKSSQNVKSTRNKSKGSNMIGVKKKPNNKKVKSAIKGFTQNDNTSSEVIHSVRGKMKKKASDQGQHSDEQRRDKISNNTMNEGPFIVLDKLSVKPGDRIITVPLMPVVLKVVSSNESSSTAEPQEVNADSQEPVTGRKASSQATTKVQAGGKVKGKNVSKKSNKKGVNKLPKTCSATQNHASKLLAKYKVRQATKIAKPLQSGERKIVNKKTTSPGKQHSPLKPGKSKIVNKKTTSPGKQHSPLQPGKRKIVNKTTTSPGKQLSPLQPDKQHSPLQPGQRKIVNKKITSPRKQHSPLQPGKRKIVNKTTTSPGKQHSPLQPGQRKIVNKKITSPRKQYSPKATSKKNTQPKASGRKMLKHQMLQKPQPVTKKKHKVVKEKQVEVIVKKKSQLSKNLIFYKMKYKMGMKKPQMAMKKSQLNMNKSLHVVIVKKLHQKAREKLKQQKAREKLKQQKDREKLKRQKAKEKLKQQEVKEKLRQQRAKLKLKQQRAREQLKKNGLKQNGRGRPSSFNLGKDKPIPQLYNSSSSMERSAVSSLCRESIAADTQSSTSSEDSRNKATTSRHYSSQRPKMNRAHNFTRSSLLESAFRMNRFPDEDILRNISIATNCKLETVRRWFNRRRYREMYKPQVSDVSPADIEVWERITASNQDHTEEAHPDNENENQEMDVQPCAGDGNIIEYVDLISDEETENEDEAGGSEESEEEAVSEEEVENEDGVEAESMDEAGNEGELENENNSGDGLSDESCDEEEFVTEESVSSSSDPFDTLTETSDLDDGVVENLPKQNENRENSSIQPEGNTCNNENPHSQCECNVSEAVTNDGSNVLHLNDVVEVEEDTTDAIINCNENDCSPRIENVGSIRPQDWLSYSNSFDDESLETTIDTLNFTNGDQQIITVMTETFHSNDEEERSDTLNEVTTQTQNSSDHQENSNSSTTMDDGSDIEVTGMYKRYSGVLDLTVEEDDSGTGSDFIVRVGTETPRETTTVGEVSTRPEYSNYSSDIVFQWRNRQNPRGSGNQLNSSVHPHIGNSREEQANTGSDTRSTQTVQRTTIVQDTPVQADDLIDDDIMFLEVVHSKNSEESRRQLDSSVESSHRNVENSREGQRNAVSDNRTVTETTRKSTTVGEVSTCPEYSNYSSDIVFQWRNRQNSRGSGHQLNSSVYPHIRHSREEQANTGSDTRSTETVQRSTIVQDMSGQADDLIDDDLMFVEVVHSENSEKSRRHLDSSVESGHQDIQNSREEQGNTVSRNRSSTETVQRSTIVQDTSVQADDLIDDDLMFLEVVHSENSEESRRHLDSPVELGNRDVENSRKEQRNTVSHNRNFGEAVWDNVVNHVNEAILEITGERPLYEGDSIEDIDEEAQKDVYILVTNEDTQTSVPTHSRGRDNSVSTHSRGRDNSVSTHSRGRDNSVSTHSRGRNNSVSTHSRGGDNRADATRCTNRGAQNDIRATDRRAQNDACPTDRGAQNDIRATDRRAQNDACPTGRGAQNGIRATDGRAQNDACPTDRGAQNDIRATDRRAQNDACPTDRGAQNGIRATDRRAQNDACPTDRGAQNDIHATDRRAQNDACPTDRAAQNDIRATDRRAQNDACPTDRGAQNDIRATDRRAQNNVYPTNRGAQNNVTPTDRGAQNDIRHTFSTTAIYTSVIRHVTGCDNRDVTSSKKDDDDDVKIIDYKNSDNLNHTLVAEISQPKNTPENSPLNQSGSLRFVDPNNLTKVSKSYATSSNVNQKDDDDDNVKIIDDKNSDNLNRTLVAEISQPKNTQENSAPDQSGAQSLTFVDTKNVTNVSKSIITSSNVNQKDDDVKIIDDKNSGNLSRSLTVEISPLKNTPENSAPNQSGTFVDIQNVTNVSKSSNSTESNTRRNQNVIQHMVSTTSQRTVTSAGRDIKDSPTRKPSKPPVADATQHNTGSFISKLHKNVVQNNIVSSALKQSPKSVKEGGSNTSSSSTKDSLKVPAKDHAGLSTRKPSKPLVTDATQQNTASLIIKPPKNVAQNNKVSSALKQSPKSVKEDGPSKSSSSTNDSLDVLAKDHSGGSSTSYINSKIEIQKEESVVFEDSENKEIVREEASKETASNEETESKRNDRVLRRTQSRRGDSYPGLTEQVINYLIEQYKRNRYPAVYRMRQFANECNVTFNCVPRVTVEQVKEWFSYKRRLERRRLSHANQLKLKEIFKKNPAPNQAMREKIAREIGVEVRTISRWFFNKRQREGLNNVETTAYNGQLEFTKDGRQKRYKFTDVQKQAMNDLYEKHKYPDVTSVHKLLTKYNIPEGILRQWFIHRRFQERADKRTPVITENNIDGVRKRNVKREESQSISGPSSSTSTSVGESPSSAVNGMELCPDNDIKKELSKLSELQKDQLEKVFKRCPTPNGVTLRSLATDLETDYSIVKLWFEVKRDNIRNSGNVLHRISKYTLKEWQLDALQAFFKNNLRPTKKNMLQLAVKLNLTLEHVATYFKNKRSREIIIQKRGGRKKVVLTPSQKYSLRLWYRSDINPDKSKIALMSTTLGLSEDYIYGWFLRQRTAHNKVYLDSIGQTSGTNDNSTITGNHVGENEVTEDEHDVNNMEAQLMVNEVTGAVVYRCPDCDLTFGNLEFLKRHERRCRKKIFRGVNRRYNCTDCGKNFPSKTALRKHIGTHFKLKPFSCDDCSAAFSQKIALENHMLRKHQDPSMVQVFKCTICSGIFKSGTSLSRHKILHTGVKPFACSTCGKTFVYSNQLKNHLITHEAIKPHTCEFCGLTFGRALQLRKHLDKIHNEDFENNTVIRLNVLEFQC